MNTTTTFTVVSTDGGPADCWLPPSALLIAKGAGRVYHIYQTEHAGKDEAFRDSDGETLVEYRSFETLDSARTWVECDVESRLRQARCVQ